MGTSQFILELPLIIVGLTALVSLISFRNNYPLALKKLSALWVFNFCVDLAGHITRYYHINNHWLYNMYFWIMYLVLAHLYDEQISNTYVHRCIRWFYFVLPVLIIIESVIYGINELQSAVIVVGGVFIIFLAAAYFRQLYLSEETVPINHDPWFWFSFGFLIHFGGTVPFLGMLNYLLEQYPSFTKFYYLYFSNSFTILLNLLIITGILCQRNYQKSP
jgi:hypothetical protein